jgi:hypothetical protein
MVLLSGGHPRRSIAQGTFFAIGAAAAASAAYGLIGAVGGLTPVASPSAGTTVLAIACVWALAWYAHPVPRLLPSPAKQVNRRYAAVPLAGSALFGAVLGVGLLTLITTPLVWAGAVAVLATGSAAAGALYGIGFAVGRTLQLFQQRLIRPSGHGDIAVRIATRPRGYHPAGAAVATCLIALAVVERV